MSQCSVSLRLIFQLNRSYMNNPVYMSIQIQNTFFFLISSFVTSDAFFSGNRSHHVTFFSLDTAHWAFELFCITAHSQCRLDCINRSSSWNSWFMTNCCFLSVCRNGSAIVRPSRVLVCWAVLPVLMEARGKYDFNATGEDELSFRKGDILKVRVFLVDESVSLSYLGVTSGFPDFVVADFKRAGWLVQGWDEWTRRLHTAELHWDADSEVRDSASFCSAHGVNPPTFSLCFHGSRTFY